MSAAATWRAGGCHCRAVRFATFLGEPTDASVCNCSICEMTDFLHVIVPESRFLLERGEDSLTEYRFNTGVARHLFCRLCGVKSFYRPRSNPGGWSVNARCLDDFGELDIRVTPFDGRDWERHGDELAHLSRETV
ncbi:MAG: GFA family protein [Caulobacteraceae bacterium]